MRDQSDEDFVSLDDDIKRIILAKAIQINFRQQKLLLLIYILQNEEWGILPYEKKFIGGFRKFIPIEGGATIRQAIEAVPF